MNVKQSWVRQSFVCLAVLALTATACNDDDNNNDDNRYTLRGDANGEQETPVRPTTNGSGTISGTYDKNTNIMQYSITWTGLTDAPIAMHLHGAAYPGFAAGIIKPIPNFPAAAAGQVSRSDTLTDAQETDMLMGKWYYNIHTPTYKGGEIRGQIFATRD